MKLIIIPLILLSTAFASLAQTIEEGKRFVYYERWQSAEKTLHEVTNREPNNPAAWYWLAQSMLAQDSVQEVKQLLAAIPDQRTKESPVLKVIAGEIMLHDSLHAQASQQFEEALKATRQRDPQVILSIVRAHLNAKRTDYAYMLDLLDKAVRRDKNNPEVYSLQGEVYRRMGDGGKAVQSYMAALQKDNSYAKASYNIGKIYLTQQNTEMFLKHFSEAVQKDSAYSPALYELYYYYYFRDVNLAREYLEKYIAQRDPSIEHDYMMTDLLYVSSKHNEALDLAKQLLQKEGDDAPPRLYKLVAYSHDALGDSVKALQYIGEYFAKASDSELVAKDFALKASLLEKFDGREMEAAAELEKAIELDTVAANKAEYMAELAELYKEKGDRTQEAVWLGKLYQTKQDPTNLDLYYWGLAHFSAGEYSQADTVFGLYTEKYPDHIHGYYWRAKSNALIDTTMEQGLAVPYYLKVIEVAAAEPEKNKSLLIQSYGYIGAYEANVKKNYSEALAHFDKILALDPANADAQRYSEVLKKWMQADTKE
jgi:tetratricopeptide (TPR) repeat protein